MNDLTDTPFFVVRMMKNCHGNYGPVLCWLDGRIVPGQRSTTLYNPAAGGVPSVTVELYIGTGVVEMEEPKDG